MEFESRPIKRVLLSDTIESHKQGYYKPGDLKPGNVRFARISDIDDDGYFNYSSMPLISIDLENLEKFKVKKGDILFARTGGAGRFALATKDEDCVFASYLIRFRFKDYFIPEFLRYYFLSLEFQIGIKGQIHGGVNQNIHAEDIKSSEIPLFDALEQTRIVAKLDALFERIDKAIALLEENIRKTGELMEAVLGEVFGSSKGWKNGCLKNHTSKIGSGATPTGGHNAYKNTGVTLIRSMNVYDEGFRKEGLAFIDEAQALKLSNVNIESKDVLLNITGASIARCCIVPDEVLPARVNQHVSIIRVLKNKLNPEFLHLFFINPHQKNSLLNISGGGATREALTKSMIENIDVPVPSINEQEKVVNYVHRVKKETLELKKHQSQKLQSLKSLKSSLLDQAFRGEL